MRISNSSSKKILSYGPTDCLIENNWLLIAVLPHSTNCLLVSRNLRIPPPPCNSHHVDIGRVEANWCRAQLAGVVRRTEVERVAVPAFGTGGHTVHRSIDLRAGVAVV